MGFEEMEMLTKTLLGQKVKMTFNCDAGIISNVGTVELGSQPGFLWVGDGVLDLNSKKFRYSAVDQKTITLNYESVTVTIKPAL